MELQILDIVYTIVGILLIFGGANYLTDGSVALAKHFNVSNFVIGLTIVALGTSMPEMVVSLVSAVNGNPDIAIGNVVGSNSFNTLVVVGVCALFAPITLSKENIRRDIPLLIATSVILCVASIGGQINRLEGFIMLCLYVALICYSIFFSRNKYMNDGVESNDLDDHSSLMSLPKASLITIIGFAVLIFGGKLFTGSVVKLADFYNIPQNIIAVTIVAGATSLPEFAASLVSLIKGKSDLAIGNIIGSNVANILLVLGTSALFTPLRMDSISALDIAFILLSSILLWLTYIVPPRNQVSRFDAILFITIYVIYIYITIA